MNASSWKQAAHFIAQHSTAGQDIQAQQLESLPLSQLSMEDSGPPQVNSGTDHPLALNTPCAPSTPENITGKLSQVYQIDYTL